MKARGLNNSTQQFRFGDPVNHGPPNSVNNDPQPKTCMDLDIKIKVSSHQVKLNVGIMVLPGRALEQMENNDDNDGSDVEGDSDVIFDDHTELGNFVVIPDMPDTYHIGMINRVVSDENGDDEYNVMMIRYRPVRYDDQDYRSNQIQPYLNEQIYCNFADNFPSFTFEEMYLHIQGNHGP